MASLLSEPLEAVGQDRNYFSNLPALLTTVIGILLSTRFLTGLQSGYVKPETDSGSPAPWLPYWIPLVGHLFSFLLDPVSFLRGAKEDCRYGLFALKLGWRNRTIVYSPSLIEKLRVGDDSGLDNKSVETQFAQSAFGLTFKDTASYEALMPEVAELLQKYLQEAETKLIDETIRRLERQLPNLVSFMESPIDQEPWERVSGSIVMEDGKTVETGLVALTQTFLTHLTTGVLLAPSLLTQDRDLAPLLLTLPSHLLALLERPIFLTPSALQVRRALANHLEPFLEALYAPELDDLTSAVYGDIETPSPFLAVLKSDMVRSSPPSTQTALLLSLLTRSIIPHTLVPWSLLQLLTPSTPQHVHLPQIRALAATKVTVTQDPGIGSIQPPPDVSIRTGTSTVLSAMLAETTMMYARGWAEFDVLRDVTLVDAAEVPAGLEADGSKTDAGEERPKEEHGSEYAWLLRQGDRVVATHWLTTESEEVWSDDKDDYSESLPSALQRLGMFHNPHLSPLYNALYPAFIAGLLRLYDVEPADPVGWKKGWVVPGQVFAPGVALPRTDVRVRLRRKAEMKEGGGA